MSKHVMINTVANTKYTFSDILCKLFKKEKLPLVLTDKDFTTGKLCSVCKEKVDNLYKLQYELREVKNKIVSTLRKSHKSDKDKNESESLNVPDKVFVKKAKIKTTENLQCEKIEIKDHVEDKPEDDVYIIESLREKKGKQFLVKWENYPEDDNTWEPRVSIPDYILQVCIINKISKLY